MSACRSCLGTMTLIEGERGIRFYSMAAEDLPWLGRCNQGTRSACWRCVSTLASVSWRWGTWGAGRTSKGRGKRGIRFVYSMAAGGVSWLGRCNQGTRSELWFCVSSMASTSWHWGIQGRGRTSEGRGEGVVECIQSATDPEAQRHTSSGVLSPPTHTFSCIVLRR